MCDCLKAWFCSRHKKVGRRHTESRVVGPQLLGQDRDQAATGASQGPSRGSCQKSPHRASAPGVPVVKNPPANTGDVRDAGSIPGSGRSPGGGRGNPSSLLAWRVTEEPGGLQSTGFQESDTNSNLACTASAHPSTHLLSSVLFLGPTTSVFGSIIFQKRNMSENSVRKPSTDSATSLAAI